MNINDVFGDPIKAPGPAGINTGTVPETVARLFSFGINIIFIIAGLTLLILLLWGALDWIMSSGEEASLEKARGKMVHALLGMLLMVAVLVIWVFISANVLGTIKFNNGQIRFNLPSINGSGGNPGSGGGTNPGGSNPGGSNPGGGNPGGGGPPIRGPFSY